jgi:hypothetical protein
MRSDVGERAVTLLLPGNRETNVSQSVHDICRAVLGALKEWRIATGGGGDRWGRP